MCIKKKLRWTGIIVALLGEMHFCFAIEEKVDQQWISLIAQTETERFFRAYTEEQKDKNTFVSFDLMPNRCDHFEVSVHLKDPTMANKVYNEDIFLGDLQIDKHESQTMTFQLSIDPEYTLLHFILTSWNDGGYLLDSLLQGKNLRVHLNDREMQFSLSGAKEALARIVGLCAASVSPDGHHHHEERPEEGATNEDN